MQIQLTTTQTNGKKDVVAKQHVRGQVLRVQAVPGGVLALEIDGQPINGATPVKGKNPVLIRQADDLIVLIDDEPVAVIGEFFATAEVTLEGSDWVLSQAAGEAMPETQDAAHAHDTASQDSGAASDDEGSSSASNGLYWALGAAGLIGGIAAASGGGSSGSSSGSGGGQGNGVAPAAQTTVSGVVVAGPVVEGHGLQVVLYKADGTVLAGPVSIDATGAFTATFDRSYTGPIVAKVIDSDAQPDYFDEATNAPKDLSGELRAVFGSANDESLNVVISPMSELAARAMGLQAGVSTTGALTVEQINGINAQVAQELGLDGGLFAAVTAVVDAQGAPVAAPNNAGFALAALSGLEQLHGADGAMSLLAQAMASNNPADITGLLISGSREAGLAANRDYTDAWIAAAPESKVAMAVRSASLLSSAGIQGWTAAQVADVGVDVIAAMTPAQFGLLTDDAAAGLTPSQLQVLGAESLAAIVDTVQLSEAQAQALSPLVLAQALDLERMAIVIRDDVAAPPRDLVQIEGAALTNDTTPTLSGVLPGLLPAGAQVLVFNGDTQLGVATVAADHRAWTFTPAQPLADGVYQLSVRLETTGGRTSPASQPVALTIDTVPAEITINGPVAGDGFISIAERAEGLTLSGTAHGVADGTDMSVTLANTTRGIEVMNGRWEVTFRPDMIPERWGDVDLVVSTTDMAGNAARVTQVLGLRTVLPVVEMDTPIADDNRVVAPEKERGVEVSGSVSNLADGQTVRVVWGDVTKTATVADQAWTVTFASAEIPADGNTNISASATDEAGNVSLAVSQAVEVSTAGDWILIDTVSGNDIINAAEQAAGVTLSGTTSLATGQQLTVNWGAFQANVAVADGAWTVAVPTANIPAEGVTPVTVEGQGANAGINASKQLTIDLTAPAAPALELTNDLGSLDNDGITSGANITVTGLEPRATWQYSLDNGATWNNGTGTHFVATPAVYAAGTMQVRQTDAAGNTSAVGSNAAQVVIDTTAPTLVITSDQATLNATQTATLTFTFSEPVTGFTIDSIAVQHGALSNFTAVGNRGDVYTATYTPAAGQVSASESVTVEGFSDVAGNRGVATTAQNLITMDTQGPSVQITSDKMALKAGETAQIRFEFSEALSNILSVNDIATQNGTLSNFQRSADDLKVYTATFTANAGVGNAMGSITVAGDSVRDADGNPGSNGVLNTIAIDTVSPFITNLSVVGIDARGQQKAAALSAQDTIRVVMTLSEDARLEGEGEPTYTIDVGGSPKIAVFNPTASSGNRLVFDYRIAAGDTDDAGGITASETALELNGAAIVDTAGNAAVITLLPPIGAGSNTVAVDTRSVRLASAEIDSAVGLAGTSLNAGDVVTVRAVFTQAVEVSGTPQLGLTIGDQAVQASYQGGSGSNELTFTYTILAGQTAANGIAIPANALTLNGGQINSSTGVAAGLELAAVAADVNYLVDTTAPTVNSVVISGLSAGNVDKAGPLMAGDKVRVTVTMDEAVTVPQGTVYNIDLDGASRSARFVGSPDPAQLVFEYVVVAGDTENTQGVTATANALVLPQEGSLADAAGNAGATAMPVVAAGANAIVIDSTAPVMQSVAVAATGSDNAVKAFATTGDRLVFTATFDESVVVSGTPVFRFALAGAAKQARYVSGSASSQLVFEYLVAAGDHATMSELAVDPATAVQLPARARIADAAGNMATLDTFPYVPSAETTPLVETRPATVQSVAVHAATGAQGEWLNVGDTVTVRVTFTQDVTLTAGQANVNIQIGDQTVTANYNTLNTATRTLDFTHTIAAGETGPNGISIPLDALSLSNDGNLTAGGNAVELASAAVPANTSFRVDTTAPEINGVLVAAMTADSQPKRGDLAAGDKVRVVVQTTENVDVMGTPTFAVSVGGTQQQATYVSGSGSKNLVFEYTVPASETPAGNIAVAANALTLAPGTNTVQDRAGNGIGQNAQVIAATTGMLDLSGAGMDKLAISADLIRTLSADRNLWVKLGQADVLEAVSMGGIEYGRWTDSNNAVYDRRWVSGEGADAVTLYAQGGKSELGLETATVQDTSVTLGLAGEAVAGAMSGANWFVEGGGTVTSATLNEAGGSVTLQLSAAPTGVLDLRYNGVDLKTDANHSLKYERLLIGTANADTLNGADFVAGDQALFANGGGGEMTGGTGSDLLVGGAGADFMTGGLGADTFKWAAGSTGTDTIRDFTIAQGDTIDLSSLAFAESLNRSNVATALQLQQAAAGSTDAVLTVDTTNASNFAAPTVSITITNGWSDAGGMNTALQDLVNQGVIKV